MKHKMERAWVFGPDGTWTFGKTVSLFSSCVLWTVSLWHPALLIFVWCQLLSLPWSTYLVWATLDSLVVSLLVISTVKIKKTCPNSACCCDSQNFHAVIWFNVAHFSYFLSLPSIWVWYLAHLFRWLNYFDNTNDLKCFCFYFFFYLFVD